MRIQMWKTVRGITILGALLFIASCAGEPEDDADEDPELGSVQSALFSCIGTGDVGAVTSAIAANCGGVAGCSNTTSTHNDLRLSNRANYCSCYEWLWSQRNLAPYKNVQIFYHNAAAGQCGSNYHIHVQKKTGNPACSTTCNNGMQGLWHMDIDTSPAESSTLCTNTDTRIDRAYNCSCTPIENKQSGVCVNPL